MHAAESRGPFTTRSSSTSSSTSPVAISPPAALMSAAANRWHHACGPSASDGDEDGRGDPPGIARGHHRVEEEDLASPRRGGGPRGFFLREWPQIQTYTSASVYRSSSSSGVGEGGVGARCGGAWTGVGSSRQLSSFVGRRGFAAAAGGPMNFYDLLGVKPGVSQVCVCAWSLPTSPPSFHLSLHLRAVVFFCFSSSCVFFVRHLSDPPSMHL